MKFKFPILGLALLLSSAAFSQDILKSSKSRIRFFSTTPVENIEGINLSSSSIMQLSKNQIVFLVPIKSFRFDKELMEEHFNENYLESDKYPNATFKGKINEKIDFNKDGVYNVTTSGKMTIHGVDKDWNDKGTITIKGGIIALDCISKVKLADFKVEIPKLVTKNISESVELNVSATYNK